MIPSGKKVSKLYSILPDDGTGDFTVVSDQKYVTGSTGLLELVPANTPAFDYSDGSGCPALLVEPQATNLVTYSEDFSNASWIKSRSLFTSNSIISPTGDMTMGYLTEDITASNTHYIRKLLTLSDGVEYVYSTFAKSKERNIICLGDNAASVSNTGVWFDLLNGLVLTQREGYVGKIEDYGNGIYRCSVKFNAQTLRQYVDLAISESDGVNIYTGDGTSGVYIWGSQLEVGTTATSYIKTEGTTVTRAADIETVTTPAGVTSITETIGGVDQTPIAVIPTTYQIPNGLINKIIMT